MKFFPTGNFQKNKIHTYSITSCLRVEAILLFSSKCSTHSSVNNLTKVRPLFTLRPRNINWQD